MPTARRCSVVPRPLLSTCVFATLAGAACAPASALTFVEELTYYLRSGSFVPGEIATTQVVFATKPAIALSAFSFEMVWSSPLVIPVASGPGSLRAWGETLAARGSFSLDPVGAQGVTGRWVANALAPSPDVIDIPYSQPLQPVFSLQTAATMRDSFVVSFQFYDIADGAGETVDTGSGFINWATMAPVPEPGGWCLLLAGLGVLSARRQGGSRS